ncbi:rho GTPase-activating protein 12 isoform X11 [Ambystoma mexicanum]|uniref:rho GTPase-activating protein 12 isoform X11 n=1 Tax=Ambystoma mexicanum TaxID=8296 RepID=UPI0037E8DCF5
MKMADKAGKTLAGPVYIEVEYDYEYDSKGKNVSIKQGEKYILLKKTNEDWWQVKKDENAKPFYVPAQYVKEVVRKALMPPPKQIGIISSNTMKLVPGLQRSTENVNKPPELSSFGKSSPNLISNQVLDTNQNFGLNTIPVHNFGPNTSPGQTLGLSLDLIQNNGKLSSDLHSPKSSSRSPSVAPFPLPEFEVEKTSFSNENSCDSAGEGSEKIHQDSESGEELSSSSTEQLQISTPPAPRRPDSPVYANLQDLKISQSTLPPVPHSSPVQVYGEWEAHRDNTARIYYYNRKTQERTWKPPRCTRDSVAYKGDAQIQGDNELSTKHMRNSFASPNLGYLPPPNSEQESPNSSKHCFSENETSPSSPKHHSKDHEKYGVLNVTKITENGKKVRKNWTSSWAVLQDSSLLFPKMQGSGAGWKFGANQSKLEFTVDLKGASIDWASKDKSSKKNVIELKTRQGTELLIQSDNETSMQEWHTALSQTIGKQTVESDEGIEDEVPDSPGVEKHDKEKDHRESKKSRSMKTSTSVDSTEQKKTKTKLKKFLTRRPTLQAVREKGYIKDQVFGCSLISLCQRENTTVPKFVTLCIDHLEEHGLDVDGLYRVSGNLAVIQKLRFAVNHDEKLDLNDSKWEDIHVITGALKMFFRELPEPLFTFSHFNDFVNGIKQDPKHRVHAVKELIKQLPKPNQDTMQVLFRHLKKVVETGEKNRMNYQSLAIVFGPTLLKPEHETGNIAIHTVYQNQIVELILLEFKTIFGC